MSFLDTILRNYEFFGFLVVLSLFLLWKKKNIRIDGAYPNMYMMLYRTRLGLDKMKSWSKKHPNVFLYLSYLSIFIGITGVVLSTVFMVWQLNFLVDSGMTQGGGFVLPIKTQSGMDSAVPVFYVPFWYWFIALFVLMIVHEFAHGVIAERFDIRIKSSGIAFFGSVMIGMFIILLSISWGDVWAMNYSWDMLAYLILGCLFMFIPVMPGAFVEPDQKDLKKKEWWKQIAVFGAGSSSNFLFGGLFLLIFIFVGSPFMTETMETQNIYFTGVDNQSSLYDYNITSGELVSVNGLSANSGMLDELVNLSVNESFSVVINDDNYGEASYDIVTFANPDNLSRGMIGISGLQFETGPKEEYSYLGNFPEYFNGLFFWMALLNIGIGIMNLLPIWITDGGQIAKVLFVRYVKKEKLALRLFNLVSWFSLVLIVFTIWPSTLYAFIGLF